MTLPLFYLLYIPAIALLVIVAIIFNGIVLIARCTLRVTFSASLEFSFSLAASDIWTSSIVVLSLILNSFLPVVMDIPSNICFGFWLEAFRTGGMLTGLLHLVGLGFSHYASVAYPIDHQRILSPQRTYILIVAMWCLPTAALICYFFAWPNQGLRHDQCLVVDFYENVLFRLSISAFLLILMAFTLIFYVSLLRRLSQVRSCVKNSSTTRRGSSTIREVLKNRRTLTTTGLILGTFIFGWLPTAVIFVLTAHNMPLYRKQHTVLYAMAIALIVVKSLINPVIYATRIPEVGAFVGRFLPQKNKKDERVSGPTSQLLKERHRSSSLGASL